MASSGLSPASSSATSNYILAFNEDASDCLLCPLEYYAVNQCVDFARRQPYAIRHYLEALSWDLAKTEASRLLREYVAELAEERRLESITAG